MSIKKWHPTRTQTRALKRFLFSIKSVSPFSTMAMIIVDEHVHGTYSLSLNLCTAYSFLLLLFSRVGLLATFTEFQASSKRHPRNVQNNITSARVGSRGNLLNNFIIDFCRFWYFTVFCMTKRPTAWDIKIVESLQEAKTADESRKAQTRAVAQRAQRSWLERRAPRPGGCSGE